MWARAISRLNAAPDLNAAVVSRDYDPIADELDYRHAAGHMAMGLVYRSERRANIFTDASYADPCDAQRPPIPLWRYSSHGRRRGSGELRLSVSGGRAGESGSATGGGRPGDCLTLVWKARPALDEGFDRAHHWASGGALSCATGTGASQFAAELTTIRSAAARGDRAALSAEVALPLLYIDRAGHKRELDRSALAERSAEVFSPPMIALLERVTLDDLSVVPREGAFVPLGAVWLVAERPGGRPLIVTIDREALDEAAAASKPKLSN
jgi:hypothetical protein